MQHLEYEITQLKDGFFVKENGQTYATIEEAIEAIETLISNKKNQKRIQTMSNEKLDKILEKQKAERDRQEVENELSISN